MDVSNKFNPGFSVHGVLDHATKCFRNQSVAKRLGIVEEMLGFRTVGWGFIESTNHIAIEPPRLRNNDPYHTLGLLKPRLDSTTAGWGSIETTNPIAI